MWAASYMLQGGRHVADVAVLYPIDSLHADYHTSAAKRSRYPPTRRPHRSWKPSTRARAASLPADYQTSARPCSAAARGLHLPASRRAGGQVHRRPRTLVLNNSENREEYQVLILPAGECSLPQRPEDQGILRQGRHGDRDRETAHPQRGIRQRPGSAAGHGGRVRRRPRMTR